MTAKIINSSETTKETYKAISLDKDSVEVGNSILDTEGKQLQKVSVTPINCNFNIVTEKVSDALPVPTMTKVESKRAKGNVTVVFAVRSPGCPGCRLHGIQLKELAERESDIALVGVVKETGPKVDRDILEFYQKYFRYPMYKDDKWGIYKVLGDRKLNVFGMLFRAPKLYQRAKRNKIEIGEQNGDIMKMGGVLVFDKFGSLHYKYHEQFAVDFDVNKLQNAINSARAVTSKQ